MKLNHFRKSKLLIILMYLAMYAAAGLLIVNAIHYRNAGPVTNQVTTVQNVSVRVDGGAWESVALPYTLRDLPAHTPVDVRAELHTRPYDCLCVKTEYSSAKVSFNGQPVLSIGQPGSYPSYFADPPTQLHLLKLDQYDTPISLEVHCTSPAGLDAMVLHPLLIGSSSQIISSLGNRLGAPMVLSLVQIIVGCVMLISSLCLMVFDAKGQIFFWLGLFSKFSGIWFLCENDFSILCFKNDSLLYLLTFIGWVSFVVPLLRFFKIAIGFTNPRQLSVLEAISAAAAVTAMLLQFTGIVSFTRSMRFFFISLPVTLVLATLIILREWFVFYNPYAKRYILPIGILAISSLMELFHYHPNIYLFSSPIQGGMFIFLFLISIVAGLSVKDSIDLKKREKQLEQERNILTIQTEEQKEFSLRLAEKEQEMSRQRHDLRHQLAAIQELSGDNTELQRYLATLIGQIPKARERFCENTVVNAVIFHYAGICEKNEIHLETKLVVPEGGTQIIDSNLCVIFSNLLENGVEACRRMEAGERFICLNSTLNLDTLTITMDNSFNGVLNKRGECFLSSKRNDVGIGLSSIRSIAKAACGDVDFHAEGNVFLSAVYLRLNTDSMAPAI